MKKIFILWIVILSLSLSLYNVQATVDLPDEEFIDSNYDGIDGDKDRAVFVDKSYGNDTNSGLDPNSPKKTIQSGIAAASATPGRDYVLIAAGYYSVYTLNLQSNVSLYGGYSGYPDWSRSNSPPTIIIGSSTKAVTGNAISNVTLQHINIYSDSGDYQGDSSYGLFLTNSSYITVHKCELSAGSGIGGSSGMDGSNGAYGAAGFPGQPGCEDSTWPCSTCSRPVGGNGGSSPCGKNGGAGGSAGHFTNYGLYGQPGIDGTPGGPGTPPGQGNWETPLTYNGADGSDGSNGITGSGGEQFGEMLLSGYSPSNGANGTDGGHGNGGGGGGGGGGGSVSCDSYGSSGGGGGGGGCGGTKGYGGTGGGGSFGIWLYNCNYISVVDSHVDTSYGGHGGSGGDGGVPGHGASGGSAGYYGGIDEQDDGSNGGGGGHGGVGGYGGDGGGGGGGPSIGIVSNNAPQICEYNNSFNLGNVGIGGSPGGNSGVRSASYGSYSSYFDADNDGIVDSGDNCPFVFNPNQENSDADAQGDVCDICPHDAENEDLDGDGICSYADNCPYVVNTDQSDSETVDAIAYWKLDEISGTVADDSMGSNDGTLYGEPVWSSGKVGGALDFDGDADYVDLPDNFPDVEDFTFEAWVNWKGGDYWQRIFDFGHGSCSYMGLGPYGNWPNPDVLGFYIWNCGDTQYLITDSLPIHEWHHVAVTLEGDVGKMYVDGSEVASETITLNPSDVVGEYSFIGKSQFGDPYFNGLMDEVAVYDRALSPEEIKGHYLKGQAGYSYVGDGVGDVCDNCWEVINPDQADSNANCPSVPYSSDPLCGNACEGVGEDSDGDGIPNNSDNCPNYPNGPTSGTCTQVIVAGPITNYIDKHRPVLLLDGDCDSGEVCEKTQADNYPPGGNGVGDACECEGSFTCDQSLGSDDVSLFLLDTGRNTYNRPCTNLDPCNGDFLCDGSVDAYDVTKFIEDTGRNTL